MREAVHTVFVSCQIYLCLCHHILFLPLHASGRPDNERLVARSFNLCFAAYLAHHPNNTIGTNSKAQDMISQLTYSSTRADNYKDPRRWHTILRRNATPFTASCSI